MKTNTQIKIAETAGITQGFLSKILAGKANPTLDVLMKIADAYGISMQALLKKINTGLSDRDQTGNANVTRHIMAGEVIEGSNK